LTAVVDLNCDMGESFGRYKLGLDEEVIEFITSANIACGYHAGDPMVMRKTVTMAGEKGVGIGAHPSFPDLQGFGRRNMDLTEEEIRNFVIYQIGALKIFAEVCGYKLQHVKPHGNLNIMAATNLRMAEVIAEAVAEVDKNLIFVAIGGTELYRGAINMGLKVASEFFADRNYNPDGTLVSRRQPNALIVDEDLALKRTVRAVREGKLEAVDGSIVEIKVDTICLHGDGASAVAFSRSIREGLQNEGVEVKPLSAFL
jgi:5-oxoprolinase (ATP-hydrolysing) subunit A